jgi:hypothetical protein
LKADHGRLGLCICLDQKIESRTYGNQFGYVQMTSPVNIATYAFGGFMLFALAIGFFAAPV